MIDRIELNAIRLSGKGTDGFFFFQPEGSGADGTRKPSEALFPLGTFARPFDPVIAADGQRGPAPTGLVLRSGDESYTMPTTDPRVHPLIPDPGLGGSGRYASWLASDGKPRIAYEVFWGSGIAGHGAGSWSVVVPSTDTDGAPAHLIEVDRTNNRIRITHATNGIVIELDATKVLLGSSTGTHPLVYETGALATYFAAASAAFTALGQTVAAPTGFTCQKVEGA